ncbi:hypothetical protein [Anabaena cylindrica]|nr:hypothetical protein [Anabaena cylindrica]
MIIDYLLDFISAMAPLVIAAIALSVALGKYFSYLTYITKIHYC